MYKRGSTQSKYFTWGYMSTNVLLFAYDSIGHWIVTHRVHYIVPGYYCYRSQVKIQNDQHRRKIMF
jgi:hypothetical protein